jgi:polyhydroxyalkanoate synthase
MDEWITQWSGGGQPEATIGTNRRRRHSSAASRALGQ